MKDDFDPDKPLPGEFLPIPKKVAPQRQRKQSIWQRIGLVKTPAVPTTSKTKQRSMTRILNQQDLVMLTDLDESRVTRRSVIFMKGEELFDVFQIKGPMGKGLCIEPSGCHVAFCAGTGVLVFLDLLSHLLLRAYYKHYVDPNKVPESMMQLKDNFTFLFYVSMPSMDSEIGLNICEALSKVSKKLGETNFKLTVRISARWDGFRGDIWDQKFIDEQLSPYAHDIKKVWISGPPAMNEQLDKSFEILGEKLGVKPHMLDAM